MIINYNPQKLQSVLNDFSDATGIRISFCDTQLRAVAQSTVHTPDLCEQLHDLCGVEHCRRSDEALFQGAAKTGKPQLHRCHRGLLDMCVPVCKEGQLLGYMIMGRIRTDDTPPPELFRDVPQEKHDAVLEHYRKLPLYSEQRAAGAARVAACLAAYILAEDMILTRKNEEAERLISYIDTHLGAPLTAEQMCRDMHLSKTMLYRLFAENMGCGVNQYVTARRIELAKDLLAHTTLSVGEVCERVSICNYTYFCRLFKKKIGMTPLQYRKNQ